MDDLLKKFSAFSVGPIVAALISFINVPLITHFISADEYGRTSMFILAQGAVSMIMYLGLDQAFVREYHFVGDKSKLMSNAIALPLAMVTIVDIVIIVFREDISWLLYDTSKELYPVIALAVVLPFMVIQNFALLKIRMDERGLYYSFFTILCKALTLLLTIALFVFYECSFRSVIYAIVLGEVINGIVLMFLVFGKIDFSKKHIDAVLIKRMLKFGLPLIPATILTWVLASTDKIMIRALCGYSELGLYTAAFKIVAALGIVQTCFTLFWPPIAYRWYAEDKDHNEFNKIIELVNYGMVLLCLIVLMVKGLVPIVLGSNYYESMLIFPFLLLYPVMYTMSEVTAVGIGFKRKTGYMIVVTAIAGAVNIGLNLTLIPLFAAKGAAMATGISYIVFYWIRTMISRKLWWDFPIIKMVVYTLIVCANCAVHTYIDGFIPIVFSLFSFIVVVLMNLEYEKKCLREIIRLISQRLEKKSD